MMLATHFAAHYFVLLADCRITAPQSSILTDIIGLVRVVCAHDKFGCHITHTLIGQCQFTNASIQQSNRPAQYWRRGPLNIHHNKNLYRNIQSGSHARATIFLDSTRILLSIVEARHSRVSSCAKWTANIIVLEPGHYFSVAHPP